jgi:type IV secretory pathway TraG/TraD family ATPase VirD4
MLADQATTVVGRKVYLWVAVQDLAQLETVYGRARANTLRNNMETQIYYRPNEDKTAEYLERRLGRVSDYAHSQTAREEGKVSLGLAEQAVPLMTSQNIMQMNDEAILAFHRNLPPMRLKRMDWRDHSQLAKKRNIPPPALAALPPVTDLELRDTDPLIGEGIIDPDEVS